ncbi:DUF4194 domain-containing protein [Microbacterium aerolatum]|uniref:DUF4194 domain-containing protein n=1 Tax=Microbacterium aerolatum TaxID=153731 RepID=UPI002000C469|nr:DUF4194 domain-containing protein [Microbacterium aerolatum]MCK3770674.1 DUF4194 domain-containing protein [Microbacterium aerolatum]
MRTPEEHATAAAVIALMRGVVYRERDETTWAALERHGAAVRDHFSDIAVDVIVDDVEGFAYLRTREDAEGEEPLPRLIRRRTLTYQASLLAVLLRRRLAEFEATAGEGRLVLTQEQIGEMLSVFAKDSTNEARSQDRIGSTIRQLKDLGFVQELRGQSDAWEVKRVLKAYVDAQTMGDFEARLTEYARALDGEDAV